MKDTIQRFIETFGGTWEQDSQSLSGGSDRKNFRFKKDNKNYIATHNLNVGENETFFYLSQKLQQLNAPTPLVIKTSQDGTTYIQEDLGDTTLLNFRLNNGEKAMDYYKKTVSQLANIQIGLHQIMDYNKCFDFQSFDDILVLRDLFYFKNYFLDFSDIQYSQHSLLKEFKQLSKKIQTCNYQYFMFRDFQARNVMIHQKKPYFIDFQGGMKGAIAYDLVSILWQAKAQLTSKEKEELYETYTNRLKLLIPHKFDEIKFREDYQFCTMIRLMQVLGAYGKLGNILQKSHFKTSINLGLENLKLFNRCFNVDEFPYICGLFEKLSDNSDIN